MESLYFLIPLSILVVAFGIRLFFWAVNSGQYDDLDGEAERILFDELDVSLKTDEGLDSKGKQKQDLKQVSKSNE